jgi:hypothetical protein
MSQSQPKLSHARGFKPKKRRLATWTSYCSVLKCPKRRKTMKLQCVWNDKMRFTISAQRTPNSNKFLWGARYESGAQGTSRSRAQNQYES